MQYAGYEAECLSEEHHTDLTLSSSPRSHASMSGVAPSMVRPWSNAFWAASWTPLEEEELQWARRGWAGGGAAMGGKRVGWRRSCNGREEGGLEEELQWAVAHLHLRAI